MPQQVAAGVRFAIGSENASTATPRPQPESDRPLMAHDCHTTAFSASPKPTMPRLVPFKSDLPVVRISNLNARELLRKNPFSKTGFDWVEARGNSAL